MTDIALDLIDSNPHAIRDVSALKELTRSIKELGVLTPILVLRHGDRFITVAGHHRVAAAREAGLTEIPAVVRDTLAEADQVAAQLAENDQRRALTVTERAHGYQSMIDLGLSADKVSKRTGSSKRVVEAAVKVAGAGIVATPMLERVQCSLEEGAALADFATYADLFERLSDATGTDRWKHTLADCTQRKERLEKVDAAYARLMAEGCRFDRKVHYGYYLSGTEELRAHKMDAADHKDCPGHTAIVDYDGNITYYCDQPAFHGWRTAAGAVSKTDEQKAAEKAKRQSRAEWKAATTVRHEFITGHIASLTHGKGAATQHVAFIAEFASTFGLPGRTTYGAEGPLIKQFWPSLPFAIAQLVALAAGRVEKAIADWMKYTGGRDIGYQQKQWTIWFEYLVSCGYALAECEQAMIAAASKIELPAHFARDLDDAGPDEIAEVD